MDDKIDDFANLPLDLVGQTENVRVVLGKLTHAKQSLEHAGFFMPVDEPEFTKF